MEELQNIVSEFKVKNSPSEEHSNQVFNFSLENILETTLDVKDSEEGNMSLNDLNVSSDYCFSENIFGNH